MLAACYVSKKWVADGSLQHAAERAHTLGCRAGVYDRLYCSPGSTSFARTLCTMLSDLVRP